MKEKIKYYFIHQVKDGKVNTKNMKDKILQSYKIYRDIFELFLEEDSKREETLKGKNPYFIKLEYGDENNFSVLVSTLKKAIPLLKDKINSITTKYSLVINEFDLESGEEGYVTILIKDINL